MRQPGRFHLAMATVLLAATLSTAGCTLFRSGQSEKTASLLAVQGDLEYAQLQARETREAMDELAVAHERDLKRAYRAFSDLVGRMTTVGGRLVRHADGMHYRGDTYLVEPEKSATECQFPRLSETAGTRPLELGEAFEPVSRGSTLVKRALREFESDITRIRDHLSRFPNPKGVETMALFMRKAQVDGESLSYALEQALSAVQEAKRTQQSQTAQTEPAPGGVAPP